VLRERIPDAFRFRGSGDVTLIRSIIGKKGGGLRGCGNVKTKKASLGRLKASR